MSITECPPGVAIEVPAPIARPMFARPPSRVTAVPWRDVYTFGMACLLFFGLIGAACWLLKDLRGTIP
jgi:hypothetical protein